MKKKEEASNILEEFAAFAVACSARTGLKPWGKHEKITCGLHNTTCAKPQAVRHATSAEAKSCVFRKVESEPNLA
jgi:hypothetical protein